MHSEFESYDNRELSGNFLSKLGNKLLGAVFPYPYRTNSYSEWVESYMQTLPPIEVAPEKPSTVDPTPTIEVEVKPDIEQPIPASTTIPAHEYTPAPLAQEKPIVVALSPDKDALMFLDETGTEELYPAKEGMRPKATTTMGRLGKAYIPLGEGTHSLESVQQATGYQHRTLRSMQFDTQCIPPNVMSWTEDDKFNLIEFHFGNIALASKLEEGYFADAENANEDIADDESVEETEPEVNTQPAEETEETHEVAQEPAYSDALITIRQHGQDRLFHLSLDDPKSVITARIIEALALSKEKTVTSRDIAGVVHKQMTPNERKLFVKGNKIADETVPDKAQLNLEIADIFRTVTNKLMLTHERHKGKFNILTKDFGITFADENDAEEFLEQNDVEGIYSEQKITLDISEEEQAKLVEEAKRYMRIVFDRHNPGQETAIEMLDFISSKEGKWALNEITGTDYSYKTTTRAFRRTHAHIESILGRSTYKQARASRQISGEYTTGGKRASQTSGELSGRTRWDALENRYKVDMRYHTK